MTTLDRNDILSGLRDLISDLRSTGHKAGIRLVGGAALALKYFDRNTTQDLDALHVSPGTDSVVSAAASRVAKSRGWAPDWLNFNVEKVGALPTFGRRTVEWETIFYKHGILIQIASKEALLAMKLRANRPGRDTNDIRQLMRMCEITKLEDAEEFYEDFYPGDALTDRAISMVSKILELGLPDKIQAPEPFEL
ncbi:MAG: hypothetical protein KF867_01550 [Cryobacterium sp.]|nr:hypothetical protein [Cryobacterium sp.]MBX3103638.1 hypothetical protein [Cryobacterium sp.]